MLFSYEKI